MAISECGVVGCRLDGDVVFDVLAPVLRIADEAEGPAFGFSRGLSPVDLPLAPLVTLRASLTPPPWPSDEPPLRKTFHPHSSATPGEQKSRALQPAPMPSTACLGSSSLRKSSQFA